MANSKFVRIDEFTRAVLRCEVARQNVKRGGAKPVNMGNILNKFAQSLNKRHSFITGKAMRKARKK